MFHSGTALQYSWSGSGGCSGRYPGQCAHYHPGLLDHETASLSLGYVQAIAGWWSGHSCNIWYALLASGIRLAILLRRSFGKWLLMELMESRNICGCTTESISWLVAWTASLSTLLLARICLEHRSKMFWR